MNKIDFVIAWVDGSDPKHQAKRAQYSGQNVSAEAMLSTRFASDDEIYFSIASILKYVPYCGKIYVVTDQQKPLFLDEFSKQGICEADQIQVVDHAVLFQEFNEYLPTFNSLTIETMLWRIPQLTKHFIYLNDDFFFNAPSKITDFLENDQQKIYGHWKSNTLVKAKHNYRLILQKYFGKAMQPKYTFAQVLSAELVGLDRYYEIHHRPHMLSHELFKEYFGKNLELMKKQISYRFRSADQFLPVGLNNHLGVSKNNVTLEADLEIAYLKNEHGVSEFLSKIQTDSIKFGCIQSLDEFDGLNAKKVKDAMISKFDDFLPDSVKAKPREGINES